MASLSDSDIPEPEIIASVDFMGDVCNDWTDLTKSFFYEHGEERSLIFLLNHLDEFWESCIVANECGFTIRIIEIEETMSDGIVLGKIGKQKIYDRMWPNNSIVEKYDPDDFEFNIEHFGFECFAWNGKYYLASGIL